MSVSQPNSFTQSLLCFQETNRELLDFFEKIRLTPSLEEVSPENLMFLKASIRKTIEVFSVLSKEFLELQNRQMEFDTEYFLLREIKRYSSVQKDLFSKMNLFFIFNALEYKSLSLFTDFKTSYEDVISRKKEEIVFALKEVEKKGDSMKQTKETPRALGKEIPLSKP